MKLGIVGLPNVGKSTLFNAITKAGAECANYPFCTIDPNVGVVAVPDKRLDFLEKLYNSKKKVYATVDFVDIAGLVKGASQGEGLGNQFLSHIRETQAIVHVVRCYENKDITHVMGGIDPLRDIEIIDTELTLADLDSMTKIYERLAKNSRMNDKKVLAQIDFAKKVKEHLEAGKPARTLELNDDEKNMLKDFFLITAKPVLYACNVGENDLPSLQNEYVKIVVQKALADGAQAVAICAKIEAELSELADSDRDAFLKDLGLTEAGLNRLIKAGFTLLGLETFLTAGEDEVRAWTIKRGFLAPQAAGVIHTDFERGFIRAEVMNYDDLFKLGSEKAVKEAGLLKSEGKEYVVKDGDIIEFRFNV
ncbi:redox-regulated ATPase YchF [Endomicrobium proavitum]|uniref:Ribosome-binding ATPase YchF n=1 Tax=Endomicrobium proavitum TaxID=1408281 RepID=A0A0G3WLD7_9BACT|nr:redox-regulated ATPase YchF [Endomicrobium proavitum]AKL98710.1 putative GTP-binding protein [Endomicrobium proavitum]